MTTESTPSEPASTERKRVATVAHRMLSGEVSFLAGATELAALRRKLREQENDPDFQIFEAIASQFGNLGEEPPPRGPAGPLVWEKQMGITACQSLVKRFHD
jgi:hypothetical protein